MKKRVLITGVYGQDGSYLSEIYHLENAEIHGVCRAKLSANSKMIKDELQHNNVYINEHYTDLYAYESVKQLIKELSPDIVIHLAAVHRSSSDRQNNNIVAEKNLYEKNIVATSNILAACMEYSDKSRIITAGSCLMFDGCKTTTQNENTPFNSVSMYGMAKIAENSLVNYYRQKNLFVCNAILYNHESHRRDDSFVTKSIVNKMQAVAVGESDTFEIGDLDAQKDWGHAFDYATAMKLMVEASTPSDYIVSTGTLHSVRDFVKECANQLSIPDWEQRVVCNKQLINRKTKGILCGDPTKCETELGWKKEYNFEMMVKEMITGGTE